MVPHGQPSACVLSALCLPHREPAPEHTHTNERGNQGPYRETNWWSRGDSQLAPTLVRGPYPCLPDFPRSYAPSPRAMEPF